MVGICNLNTGRLDWWLRFNIYSLIGKIGTIGDLALFLHTPIGKNGKIGGCCALLFAFSH
jgi:hypothetical protein